MPSLKRTIKATTGDLTRALLIFLRVEMFTLFLVVQHRDALFHSSTRRLVGLLLKWPLMSARMATSTPLLCLALVRSWCETPTRLPNMLTGGLDVRNNTNTLKNSHVASADSLEIRSPVQLMCMSLHTHTHTRGEPSALRPQRSPLGSSADAPQTQEAATVQASLIVKIVWSENWQPPPPDYRNFLKRLV